MVGLVHKAYPNGCGHRYAFLPMLRPYLVTGPSALVFALSVCMSVATTMRLSVACNKPSCNSLPAVRHMTN